MQSKLILTTTLFLIVLPAVFFFFADFADLPFRDRILASLFQAITPRTAGFNTVDLNSMSGSSRAIVLLLMLIGGSPGSTAGGMKITTFAVLLIGAASVFRRNEDTEVFGRRLYPGVIRHAATILVMYFFLFFTGAIVISTAEGLPFGVCLFETASAIGTVGLTLGITPGLGLVSQGVLILLMFFGRVGGLTMIFAALSRSSHKVSKLPLERITVG